MAWMIDLVPLLLAAAAGALLAQSVMRQVRRPVPVRVRNRRVIRR